MKQTLEKIVHKNFLTYRYEEKKYEEKDCKYTSVIDGKRRYGLTKKFFNTKNVYRQEVLSLLEIENISYSMIGEHCIEINQEDENSFFIALDKKGTNQLGFLNNSFPKGSLLPFIKEEVTVLERKYNGPAGLRSLIIRPVKEDIIFALKTSKLEDVKDYSLETLRRIYEDIKPTISRYFIDGLNIGKIKYLKEFDTYVITEIDDYVEYNGIADGIELSFESFLNGNSFYLYKNRAINLKEYNFLKGVK